MHKLKRKFFYNPLIRYAFLNTMKLNLASMVTYKNYEQSSAAEVIVAALILSLLNILPIALALVVYWQTDRLELDENTQKFGTIYEGRNVSSTRNHRVWFYPFTFFTRRMLFMMLTVFLIETPQI